MWAGGCWPVKPATTQPTTQEASPERPKVVLHTVLTKDAQPLVYRLVLPEDPPLDPAAYVMVHLHIFDITAPLGVLSNDTALGELLSPLAAADAQALERNGVRLGTAPQERWDEFKAIFDRYSVKTAPTTVIGPSGRSELMMQRSVPSQAIFHLDSQGQLVGRSYDNSDNFWAVRFAPLPQQAGVTQVSLSPAVKAARKRMEVSRSAAEYQFSYVQPETVYDLSLTTNLERGRFLMVLPAAGAVRQTTSLASAFLSSVDDGQRLEHVLVISPRIYLFDEAETKKLEQTRKDPLPSRDGQAPKSGAKVDPPRSRR